MRPTISRKIFSPAVQLTCLLLSLLLFVSCSRQEQTNMIPQAMAEDTYYSFLNQLQQAELLKIITHNRTQEEIRQYLYNNQDRFILTGTLEEEGRIFDDYRPAEPVAYLGCSFIYDLPEKTFGELGVGLSESLAQQADGLLAKAQFSKELKTAQPFSAKTLYHFGFIPYPLVSGMNLEITMIKTIFDQRPLYSIVYKVVSAEAASKPPASS